MMRKVMYGRRVYPYLMILDREEDKAMRVLLEQRLISFFRLNCWRNSRSSNRFLLCLDNFEKRFLDVGVVNYWSVVYYILFADSFKVDFLGWGIHLKVLNPCCSLASMYISINTKVGRDGRVAGAGLPSLKA